MAVGSLRCFRIKQYFYQWWRLRLWCLLSFPQRSQPGRLPDTSLPTIQNSVSAVDFSWDPFDTHRLAVGKR